MDLSYEPMDREEEDQDEMAYLREVLVSEVTGLKSLLRLTADGIGDSDDLVAQLTRYDILTLSLPCFPCSPIQSCLWLTNEGKKMKDENCTRKVLGRVIRFGGEGGSRRGQGPGRG